MFNATRVDPQAEKPPDNGLGCPLRTHGVVAPKLSFRDKVVGGKQAPPPLPKVDLVAEKLMTIELEGDNRLLPKISLDKKIFEDLCQCWRDALVIKLLGKNIGCTIMKDRLHRLWKPKGGFDIIDVDNGYYMVKFDMQEDKDRIVAGGPWMLFDHYLCVFYWSPDFASSNAKIQKTMVWVRFLGLNLLYYSESVLMGLASVIGKPIRVDTNTLNVEWGRFARVCVEIDLTQPVVGKYCLDDHWYRVEYEGLHLICSKCGCCGHVTRNCSQDPEGSSAPSFSQDTTSSKDV